MDHEEYLIKDIERQMYLDMIWNADHRAAFAEEIAREARQEAEIAEAEVRKRRRSNGCPGGRIPKMKNRPKNDHAIFFRLPTALVDRIDEVAYDLHTSRTEFIRQAIFRALDFHLR